MPSIGRFPCETCEYVANNRRMLARHVAVTHSDKVFKCPVCPFITRYAANWYRHKRDIHGLSKFTTCEVCGFFAHSTQELAEHAETEHPEHLQIRKYQAKYAKEKQRLAAQRSSQVLQEFPLPSGSNGTGVTIQVKNDNKIPLMPEGDFVEESVQFSLPLDGTFLDNDLHFLESNPEPIESSNSNLPSNMDVTNKNYANLSPLKVRRSYCCDLCGLLTSDPREFLYHQKDVHNIRMTVHECTLCIYASKHIQKLQRHYNLVHRQKMPEEEKPPPNPKSVKAKHVTKSKVPFSSTAQSFIPFHHPVETSCSVSTKDAKKPRQSVLMKCTACSYQTRSKFLLIHHEKTVHLKKKFFRCLKCGYVTNEKARYTKHIKYHNLPKMQCEFCHFKSAYKWNMERHMKNHSMGREGEFNCTLCNFITHSKQSLKLHVINHHDHFPNKIIGDNNPKVTESSFSEPTTDHSEFEWIANNENEEYDCDEPDSDAHVPVSFDSSSGEPSFMSWEKEQPSEELLHCTDCSFTTTLSFEIKKHEEMHKTASKRHSCPLCGMRFEHIAWLAKHLRRIHKENAQAKNIAAAFEILKPSRRRPAKNVQTFPGFENTLKQVASHLQIQTSPKQSVLSSLLKSSTPSRYSPIRPKFPVSNKNAVSSLPTSNKTVVNSLPASNKTVVGSLPASNKTVVGSLPASNKTIVSSLPASNKTIVSSLPANKTAPISFPTSNKTLPSSVTATNKPIVSSVSTSNKPVVSFHPTPNKTVVSSLLSQQDELAQHSIVIEKPIEKISIKRAPACKYCGYKTKWISELEKHMRVHSDEKPFRCSRCSYHSKWKGDLTRHMIKHHGAKFPIGNKKFSIPKIRLKKALSNKTLPENHWQTIHQEMLSENIQENSNSEENEQDSPLDLTVCKSSIFYAPESDVVDLSFSSGVDTEPSLKNEDSESSFEKESLEVEKKSINYNSSTGSSDVISSNCTTDCPDVSNVSGPSSPPLKKKYFCPFCSFTTSTPSRFHVHIVQHYNKKPFMCSLCGYRSNWEWDITKHIRLRGCKDKEHNSACVLLTDETGKRNYEKYEKYLKDVPCTKPSYIPQQNTLESVNSLHRTRLSTVRENQQSLLKNELPEEVSVTNTCGDEAPINIVVTPDISFANDCAEELGTEFPDDETNPDFVSGGFKFYLCKHCNYKHSSRKVVVSHLSIHAGVRPFRCKVCGMTSNWRHVVVRHVKEAHNGYMNDVEDRITYVQEGFVIRITSVKNCSKSVGLASGNKAAQFTCKFCPYKCDKEVYIKFHMKQHKPRDGAIYQCTSCPYYVKFKKTLVRHMKLHEISEIQEPGTDFAAEEIEVSESENFMNKRNCSASANSLVNDIHSSIAEDEDSITINYSQLSAPDVHLFDVSKYKRHMCECCPYRTDNRTQYLYHKQFHRPNSAAPFKCSICSYWATLQHLLTQHMKVHRENEADRLVQTQVESKGYHPTVAHTQKFVGSSPTTGSLAQIPMILVQRGGLVTKMFKCRFCPMMNKKRANVRVHERMHGATTNDGKYTCRLCNYKCLGQGSLTNHMKIHQNDQQTNDAVSVEERTSTSSVEEKTATVSDIAPPYRKKVFSYFCMRCPAVFKSSSDLYIHKTFHGSTLPYPCPYCDYRAKHKPHLHKHLQVHTDTYVAKRDASFGPPVTSDPDNYTSVPNSGPAIPNNVITVKRVDQLLLLEAAEIRMSMKQKKDFVKRLHKCPHCPSLFSKTAVLAYHVSLHGSSGEFGCTQCDYATTSSANLSVHVQMHTKPSTHVKRPGRIMQCSKCPATFNKVDRYERHLNLHGKNFRFGCDVCDYSVRFAANLTKHKLLHRVTESPDIENSDANNLTDLYQNVNSIATQMVITENTNTEDSMATDAGGDKKQIFTCDRCPYMQARRDAVHSHQNRHFQKEGYGCSYCDYRSMGSAFLKEHIKSHVQRSTLCHPQTFMRCNKFEVRQLDEHSENLVFMEYAENEIPGRLLPPAEKNNAALFETAVSGEASFVEKANEKCLSQKSVRSRLQYPVNYKEFYENDSLYSSESFASDRFRTKMVPKVILTDIFSCSKNKIKAFTQTTGSLMKGRREKKEISKSKNYGAISKHAKLGSSLVTEKSGSKSSLIVKIKVGNIIEDNNERPLYTISSKNKTDSCSDAASDVTLPIDDFEGLSPASDDDNYEKPDKTVADLPAPFDNGIDLTSKTCRERSPESNDADKSESQSDPLCAVSNISTAVSSVLSSEKCSDLNVFTSKFQPVEPEVDFLKSLDSMVNGIHLNSSLVATDVPSANWQL